MSSCSAINTMYGGKKSRSNRRNKRMRGGDENNRNVLERAADATIGTTLGVVSAVKETTGEVASEGVSMLSKLGSIFSATGEKIKDTGSKLYGSLTGEEEVQEDTSLIGKVGTILSSTGEKLKESSSKLYQEIVDGEESNGLSGGRRRRRHKTVKRSRRKHGGKRKNVKSKRRSRRHSKNMNMNKHSRNSRKTSRRSRY